VIATDGTLQYHAILGLGRLLLLVLKATRMS